MSEKTATEMSRISIRPFETISHNLVSVLKQLPEGKRKEFCAEVYRVGLRMGYVGQWLGRGATVEQAIDLSGVLE